MYLNWMHIHLFIHFLEMPVEPFKINKDTQIVKKLLQCQRPRHGLTRNHISESYVMTYVS